VNDVISEVVFGPFWLMGPTARPKYLAEVFIGNYARVRVFYTFDQLFSISGSKVSIKNKQIN